MEPATRTEGAPQPRLMFDRTDWSKVGQKIQENMTLPPRIESRQKLDKTVDNFINITVEAVKEYTPLAKPSLHAKRWFNPDLKKQQAEHNKSRRRWQSSCAVKGKDDPVT